MTPRAPGATLSALGMQKIGYGNLLRAYPDFRRVWLGELVSFLGDWFNTIAVYAVVQALSSSGQAVAAVLVARLLPIFVMSPVAGPIVDRFDRKWILVGSDIARATCVGLLIVGYQIESLGAVFCALVVMMVFTGLAVPAKNASIPMVVNREHLSAANALSGGTWSVMLAFGAALGGLATELLGVTAALVVDACTYLVSMSFFLRLPSLKPPASEARGRAGFIDGLRYLRDNPAILSLAGLKPMLALPMGAVALIPLFGALHGGASASGYTGAVFAARGVGALIGSVFVRMLIPETKVSLRRALAVGYALVSLGYLGVALPAGFAGVTLGYALAAVGGGMVWVFSGTLLQLDADAAQHGRVFAFEFGTMTLVASASSWSAGFLVDLDVSLARVSVLCAGASLVALAVWLTVLFRDRRARIAAAAVPVKDGG